MKILHSVCGEVAKHHSKQWIRGLICFFVMMNKTSLCFSLVAFALSAFAVYAALSNPVKDQSSNLIATIGIICTVLIGWQILSLINLSKYEKRMEAFESKINEVRKHTDELFDSAFMSLQRSDGAAFHALADVYRHMGTQSSHLPQICLSKEILWLMAELENCLYTQDISELSIAKDNLSKALDSPVELDDPFRNELKIIWKRYSDRFLKSSYPKPKQILDEIYNVTSLLDSSCQ